jgi:hypothetical protein
MNTAINFMFSNIKGKGETSYRKTERDKEIIINKIKRISIIIACFLFFVWCNFVAICVLCQDNKMDFIGHSFFGTWLFIFDVVYCNFAYTFFKSYSI